MPDSLPYKFGIMVNRLELYPWQIKVFQELMNTGLAECCLVIIKEDVDHPKRGILKKISDPHLLFEQYKKRKLNTSLYHPTYFSPIMDISHVRVETIKIGKAKESLKQSDVDLIRSHHLDFIIRFGFGILQGDVLQSSKWGIWSFHHGDESIFRGGPPGFWEMMKKTEKQGVLLQQLTSRLDAGKKILKRHYRLIKHSYSEHVTRFFMHSTDMPAQALKMIHAGEVDPANFEEIKTNARVYRYPNNLQFIQFICRTILEKIKFRKKKIFNQENWAVGYKRSDQTAYSFVGGKEDGTYLADPFVIYKQGQPLIVAEDYSYKTGKGSLSTIHPGTHQIKKLLDKANHLAYPYVLEDNGKTYIIPEEANTNSCNLYEWDEKNSNLNFISELLSIDAVDPSILKYNGKYWLFCGIKSNMPNEKLFIYYSDNLKGPYHSHICNPVKSTPQGSRMGGGFIMENDQILRPSQCSVHHYGEKIIFHRITRLSETSYEEVYHSEMLPPSNAPFKCGLHTYHKNGNFEVIDVKRMKTNFAVFNFSI